MSRNNSERERSDGVPQLRWQANKARASQPSSAARSHWDGIAAHCQPENKVSLGFVEGLNNKIRVIQN
jgi:transposase